MHANRAYIVTIDIGIAKNKLKTYKQLVADLVYADNRLREKPYLREILQNHSNELE